MVLTGEVGTGKTTLCRALLDRLQGQARTVYVINPSLSGKELIAAILDDLGTCCNATNSKKGLIDRLNRFLLNEGLGQPVVIIIDDAQTMPMETLRICACSPTWRPTRAICCRSCSSGNPNCWS